MQTLCVGAVSLNQIPLAWEHNLKQILTAIEKARQLHVKVLCCPELCITGYGCEDNFLSQNTLNKALESLSKIVPHTQGIAVSVGLPLSYEKNIYNVACFIVDGEIQGFSAKQNLPNHGVHYEPRWFTPWPKGVETTIEIKLMGFAKDNGSIVSDGAVHGEIHSGAIYSDTHTYPLGDLVFTLDKYITVGFEICEDAWVEDRPLISLAKRGANLILNPSASHFAMGKSELRKERVLSGAGEFGVAYVYANLLGNEAGRLIYDGDTFIVVGEELLASGLRFSFQDYVLTTAAIEIKHLLESRQNNAKNSGEAGLSNDNNDNSNNNDTEKKFIQSHKNPHAASWEKGPYRIEEEFTRAITLGLFDYLRKSKAQGFVLNLSGGADSSACACLIYLMVHLAIRELGPVQFQEKLTEIAYLSHLSSHDENFSEKVLQQLLFCLYQKTDNNTAHTLHAAEELCRALNLSFAVLEIEDLVRAYCDKLIPVIGRKFTWEKDDTALQNIQARVRSPSAWLLANVRQAILICAANRSEASLGYTTMDGDTSGGLCPLAGIDKHFILRWITWLQKTGVEGVGPISILEMVLQHPASAELKPKALEQTDEKDLMPFEWIEKIERWCVRDKLSPIEILMLLSEHYPDQKVNILSDAIERFFKLWAMNQWKRERLAPSFHLDDESVDPKTWCRFPILSEGFTQELAEMKAMGLEQSQ